jgi:hypothetical protein
MHDFRREGKQRKINYMLSIVMCHVAVCCMKPLDAPNGSKASTHMCRELPTNWDTRGIWGAAARCQRHRAAATVVIQAVRNNNILWQQ